MWDSENLGFVGNKQRFAIKVSIALFTSTALAKAQLYNKLRQNEFGEELVQYGSRIELIYLSTCSLVLNYLFEKKVKTRSH